MWVIVHSISGAAVGAALDGRLGLALIGAHLAHLVLDLVPHWDYTRHRKATLFAGLDVAASTAFLLGGLLFFGLPWTAFWAGVASALPDLDVLDVFASSRPRRRLFPSHWSSYPHGRAEPLAGMLTQVLVVIASSCLIAFA